MSCITVRMPRHTPCHCIPHLRPCRRCCAVLFPPLTAVLLHGITTATSMNPGSFCSGPLLTGAIAAEHQRALASLLDWAVIPLVVVQPIAEPLAPLFTGGEGSGAGPLLFAVTVRRLGSPTLVATAVLRLTLAFAAAARARHQLALCLAPISWLHTTVGFVLPVLFNSWCWRPPLAGAAAGEAATSSGVRQRLGRTIAACNRSLYQLLGGTADSTIGRVGIAYFIFGTAWLLSKDLASKEWV